MASGIQSSITEICEQVAFYDGAKAAFTSLSEIFDMPTEERMFLFGSAGLPDLVKNHTPEEIFEILNNKETLLAKRLQVGDIVYNKERYNIIVTWVDKDQIHFDGIWDDGPNRGRTLSNCTLKDLDAHKDMSYDKQDIYCLQVNKYNWE